MTDARLSQDGRSITVRVPMAFAKRGGRKLVISPDGALTAAPSRPRLDNTMVKALARAFRWRKLLETGAYATIEEIAAGEKINPSYVSRVLRLTLLAPDIVEAILDGRQPEEITLAVLMHVSTAIIDILAAAGITTPDISILSDEFLAEVQQLEKKNLALEALRKLLNDEIRSRSKTNVVETKRFSERLEAAIARYHTNAISTVEVLQELIDLAKEVRAARRRGEDEGLSQDEIAFYDALAENESAIELMGNDSLKVIAHELLISLKGSITVDWSHRESARARMRVLVKRILRKHGYPPDLQDAAVQTVLRQAEALSAQWAV